MFTRLIISVRWSMVVAVAILFGMWVASSVVDCALVLGPRSNRAAKAVEVRVYAGVVTIIWDHPCFLRSSTVDVRCTEFSWHWGFDAFYDGPNSFAFVGVPGWALLLAPATLAVTGIWLRRSPAVVGVCPHCKHRLADALRCPECGCTSPSN